MKKILSLIFSSFVCLSAMALLIYETSFLVDQIHKYSQLFPDGYLEIMRRNYGILPLRLLFYAEVVAFSIFVLVKSENAHHAARLTYEEYRERAKQKKLEKTRKKMQELEEKLQKESTE